VIRSFASKALRQFAEKGDPRKLPVPQVDRVRRILALLDAAKTPRDLDLPGLMFHTLQGLKRYSVRLTANYRITWGWEGTDAVNVDLEDYH
jgi:proteic killer suppression protein